MKMFGIAIAIGLILAAPGIGVAQQTGISASNEASIQHAVERGRMIYAYDQAAWHGTDDMLTMVSHPETLIGGWIVDGPADAPELVFFDKNEADPHAVYVAQFRNNKLASSRLLGFSDETKLSPERIRLIRTRKTALDSFFASKVERCTERSYNTVVLPPSLPGGPTLVYVLTPQTDNDTMPFGGHYLIEVASDGKASAPRPFTKSCISLPLRDKGTDAPAALTITHLLDPVPTEIHVFTSLSAHMPIFVLTTQNRLSWTVEGGRISTLDLKKTK